ncbi:MAG: hypothetical protein EBX39_11670 [Actinobacteria bacterium]|nr:hypothetical protein [Actinomycetota bacterium]
MEATSLRFAAAARTLGQVARREGLVVPSFRSPPRTLGLDRSIRRLRTGVVVSVRLRDRPWIAVLVDMIDGVVTTNLLEGVDAARLRSLLWEAAMADELVDATSFDVSRVA